MINFKKIIQLLFVVNVLLLLFSCASLPEAKKPYWVEVANTLSANGIEYYKNQQFVLAKKEFLNALKAYQRFNDVQGMAQCRLNLTKTRISLGENADQDIAVLYQLIDDHALAEFQVHADITQASIYINKKLYDDAENVLNKYIHKTDLQKDIYIAILINRLRVAFAKGIDIDQWLQKYELFIDKNNSLYHARLLRFKAQYSHINKHEEKSNQLFEKALNEYRLLANPKGVFSTLKEWGDGLAEQKDWNAAVARYNSALMTAQSTGIENDVLLLKKLLSNLNMTIKSMTIKNKAIK